VHLAYAAKEAGKKVLLVDMDKQGSMSLSFLAQKDPRQDLLPLNFLTLSKKTRNRK